MPLQIRRRPRAAQDVEGITDYIAKDRLESTLKFLENTESMLKDLAKFPGIGSLFESEHSELANLQFRRVSGFPNHVIFYFVHADAIEVLRILHGAQTQLSQIRKSMGSLKGKSASAPGNPTATKEEVLAAMRQVHTCD